MKLAIADNRISAACERSLLRLGFRVIKMPSEEHIPAPMASHPDMLMLAHKSMIISSCGYAERADYIFSDISECIGGLKMTFTSESAGEKYPYDCIFNALIIGDKMFVKTDTCARAVLDYAAGSGITVIHTNQGYPACTVLPLGDNHAVTSDKGMADILRYNGISVTQIENGDISLSPYEYGFIGGTAGILDRTVYFLGDPSLHRDFEKIRSAIFEAGMTYKALSDEPLADLGRLILYDCDKNRKDGQ